MAGKKPAFILSTQKISKEEFCNTSGEVCCILIVSFDNANTVEKSKKRRSQVFHSLATLATNVSMAIIFSSSTFAIKMMEPLSSAIVQYMLVGTLLTPLAVFSLPFIVAGAIGFAGNPLDTTGTGPGMLAAFSSNIILAFRNIEIKKMSTNSESLPLTLRQKGRDMLLPFAFVMTALSMLFNLETRGVLPINATFTILCACLSGIFHVAYSYVSTALVLTQISVVSHAVVNIMKRLLVVLLLYIFGQRTATVWNFLGLLVCTTGLLIYAWDKSRSHDGAKYKGISMFSIGWKWIIVTVSALGFLAITFPKLIQLNSSKHLQHFKPNDIKTFENGGLNKPHYTQFLPKLSDLPGPLFQEFTNFLKLPLEQNVRDVNFLSEKLSNPDGIIRETQRLHFNIIGRELKDFKYAFLFDIATFENKGDPAITVGEIYFLARMNIEIKYYCSRCAPEKLKKAQELAENYRPKDLVILVHGGGNIIGYAASDLVRFSVLDLFPSFKILVFPQSIWIRNWASPHVNRTARNYCCNPNLTIVLRDSLSYSIAKKLYKGTTKLIMAPDMAFQIGHVPRFMSPVFDIMWIKRKDGETPSYQPPAHVPKHLKVHVSDWWRWPTPIAGSSLEKAFYVATNGFFYLQRGRVVITDRLHGHILSTLMNIPHVIIDNKAKKLSSYHNTWTRSLNNTVITDKPSKALGLAIELLNKFNNTLPPVVPFLHLREDFSHPLIGVPDTTYP